MKILQMKSRQAEARITYEQYERMFNNAPDTCDMLVRDDKGFKACGKPGVVKRETVYAGGKRKDVHNFCLEHCEGVSA